MAEWILSSSILICAVILLRRVFRNRLRLTVRYGLWALVLVRLLLPVSFGSTQISVDNWRTAAMEQPTVQDAMALGEVKIPVQSYEQAYGELVAEYEAQGIDVEALQSSQPQRLEQEVQHRMEGPSLAQLLRHGALILWILGAAVVSGLFLYSNWRFDTRLRRGRTDTGLRKEGLTIYSATGLEAPCLFGFPKPAIYVTPEAEAEPVLLRHSLEHEATHFRHGDHVWALLRAVCLALHWYNPLVWWAAILSRRDAELACDEATIARLGESERAEYGRTLIGMTCGKKTNVLMTATTMTSGGKSLRERILLIARKPKMAAYTLIVLLLIMAVAIGCTFTGGRKESQPETTDPTETTAPTESTQPIETTVPPETSVPVEQTIPWTFEYANRKLYSYEDYFAFEQEFRSEGGSPHIDIYVVGVAEGEKGLRFMPYEENGKLYLKDQEETICFQVGDSEYEDLSVLGTDGYQWIYCLEDRTTLFRIDPLGNQQHLYTAEYGIIDASRERFYLSDWHNVAFFVAGTEEGWGIYRIHLPSRRVDLLESCREYITYFGARSNYEVYYEKEGGNGIGYSTPGLKRDTSDPRIAHFQWLLAPNDYGILNGANNWYNNVVGCNFESPEKLSLSGLFNNGFRDLPTKLTAEELALLGQEAKADTRYWKLPGTRIDQVLQTLFGITRADLEQDTLLNAEPLLMSEGGVLYDPASDTYYRPCSMVYGEDKIYIWDKNIRVDKVEETGDGLIRVWYTIDGSFAFGSDSQTDVRLMTLRLVNGTYRIVSNGNALTPLGTSE